MHLIDKVSSNRTEESTNLLKTGRKEQTREQKEKGKKKKTPWHTVHGGAGVHRKIPEKSTAW